MVFLLWALLPTALAAEDSAVPQAMKKMQENQARFLREADEQEEKMMEAMKAINPEAYKQRKAAIENQKKINSIASLFYAKKMSESEARSRLTPLLGDRIRQEAAGVDSEIHRLEKKLESLKQVKGNSSALLKRRIDQILGLVKINPEDAIF